MQPATLIGYSPAEGQADGHGHRLDSLFLDVGSGRVFHGADGQLALDGGGASLAFACPRCERPLRIDAAVARGAKGSEAPLLDCRGCAWDSRALRFRTLGQAQEAARAGRLRAAFADLVLRRETDTARRARARTRGPLRLAPPAATPRKMGIEEFARMMERREDALRGLKGAPDDPGWEGLRIEEHMWDGTDFGEFASWRRRVDPCESRISRQPPAMKKSPPRLVLRSPYTNQRITPKNYSGPLSDLDVNAGRVLPRFDACMEGGCVCITIRNVSQIGMRVWLATEESSWSNSSTNDKLECEVGPKQKEVLRAQVTRKTENSAHSAEDDDYRLIYRALFEFKNPPERPELYNIKWSVRVHISLLDV